MNKKPSKGKALDLMASFPMGILGHDRPPAQQGTPKLVIDPPKQIPKHPMAALPFLLAASRQRDPFEEEGRSEEKGRPSTERHTQPDPSLVGHMPP